MAGEWIPVDLNLSQKIEIQELIDLSGESVEICCWRMVTLWGWYQVNTVDGVARMTPSRLARVCGGTAEFWSCVEQVGWLEINIDAGLCSLPGWDERFSERAKARLKHRESQRKYREKTKSDEKVIGVDHEKITREEESNRRVKKNSSSPASPIDLEEGWQKLRAAWGEGIGKRYKPAKAPREALARLEEPGWLDEALQAIKHLPACKFFSTPPTLLQLVKDGFVQRVLAGGYDDKKRTHKVGTAGAEPAREVQEWAPEYKAALQATREKLAKGVT